MTVPSDNNSMVPIPEGALLAFTCCQVPSADANNGSNNLTAATIANIRLQRAKIFEAIGFVFIAGLSYSN